MTPTPAFDESVGRGHEQRDVHIGFLFKSLVGLVLIVLAGLVGMELLFGSLDESAMARADATPRHPLAGSRPLFPEPRLQTRAKEDLQALLRANAALLGERYGWVDRGAQIVRIPIEQAMAETLEQGLPARSLEEREEPQ